MSRLTRDGTAEPVSRDQILRHEHGQGNIIFHVQLTTSRIGNLSRLIHILLLYVVVNIHACVNIPSFVLSCMLHFTARFECTCRTEQYTAYRRLYYVESSSWITGSCMAASRTFSKLILQQQCFSEMKNGVCLKNASLFLYFWTAGCLRSADGSNQTILPVQPQRITFR